MSRLFLRVVLLFVSLALASAVATGHAKLVKSVPKAGSVVRTPPKVVRAWFNDELDPKRSVISVWDARGRRVDDGRGGVDLNDLDRRSMIVRLRTTPAGTFTVTWQATSADDGFVARGSFRFTVKR